MLGSLLSELAQVLVGFWGMVWLRVIQILLGSDAVQLRYGKNLNFSVHCSCQRLQIVTVHSIHTCKTAWKLNFCVWWGSCATLYQCQHLLILYAVKQRRFSTRPIDRNVKTKSAKPSFTPCTYRPTGWQLWFAAECAHSFQGQSNNNPRPDSVWFSLSKTLYYKQLQKQNVGVWSSRAVL